ncbi:phage tail protein [Paenibacillus sp. MMO-58]|uniref:phage tail protein n=1 Tax=Paenibacillus sp. MMO-58 TaxID=3081290 RepID=UPI00301A9572
MAVVKNLMIRAGADFSGMRNEMKKAQQNIADFKNKVSGAMKAITATLAAVGIGAVFKDAAKQAMTYEAAVQQINRQMGTSAKAFDDWAKSGARAFGLGRTSAIQYGATFGNLISSFASGTDDVMRKTQDLLKAAGVVASAKGRSMQDVTERIRSGLLGETDAIEDLGININQSMLTSTAAFKRFAGDKSWSQLSFQTQQQILYFAILEQASRKYGDTVADNTSTKLLMFTETLKDVKTALGQVFLPILNVVLPILTKLAQGLLYVMNIVAQFSQALFGKSAAKQTQAQTQVTGAQTAAVGDLGDAYKAAGKAAKKAASNLASFDETHNLDDNSGDTGGGDNGVGAADGGLGATTIPPLDMGGFAESTVAVSEKIKAMADKVKAAIGSMSDFIKEHKDIIIAALSGIGAALAAAFLISKWGAIVKGVTSAMSSIGSAFALLMSPIGLIAIAIAAAVAAFVYFYRTNDKFKGFVDGILKAIGEAAQWLWEKALVPMGDWLATKGVEYWNKFADAMKDLWNNILKPFGAWLMDVLPKAWQAVQTAAEWLWKNVLVPFGEFMQALWEGVLRPLSSVLADELAIAFDVVSRTAKSLWENVLVPLGKALKEMFGPAVEAVSAVLTFLWQKVMQPLRDFIVNNAAPAFNVFGDVLTTVWNTVLKPLASYIGDVFFSVFDNTFRSIGTIIKGAKDIFIGLMNFITGVFTGDWKTAWEGVQTIFKGVFESLWGIVKFPLNMIIDGINTMIEGINSIKLDVPEWVTKLFGYTSFGFHIPKIPKLARGGIVDGKTNMGNYIAGEAGAEMIVPLENTSFTDKIASALGTAVMTAMQMGQGGSRGGGDIVIQVGGTELARVIQPYTQKESSRIGGSMIVATGG